MGQEFEQTRIFSETLDDRILLEVWEMGTNQPNRFTWTLRTLDEQGEPANGHSDGERYDSRAAAECAARIEYLMTHESE